MAELININTYPLRQLLPRLLQDKTTKKNILWITEEYADKGAGFGPMDTMQPEDFYGEHGVMLQPRVCKALAEQQQRTRKKAEVMTPVWICNKMNNYADEQWFGFGDVFNHENEDHSWVVREEPIPFGKLKWQKYIDSRRLEITCGEGPYLVSRYDTTTGEVIEPLKQRIGILDRKFRVVKENTDNGEAWLKWAIRAIQSCYGYEYQGDNLLIARINVLETFREYYIDRFKAEPELSLLKKVCNIIAWNLWQMDGLKDIVPGSNTEEQQEPTLFDFMEPMEQGELTDATGAPDYYCKIKNWRSNEVMYFKECKER